jgi:PAS domain S-box-containing protein
MSNQRPQHTPKGRTKTSASQTTDATKDTALSTEADKAAGNIQQIYLELEQRIYEHTMRLEEANTRLQHEIAERAQTEEALRESETQFHWLAEALPHFVWISRSDGKMEFCNQRCFEYLGLNLEQIQNQELSKQIHPDDQRRSIERWQQAIQRGEPLEVEYRLRSPSDDTYRWYLVRAVPIKDGLGNITKWCGTGTDIDDQKGTEAELVRLLMREQKAREEVEHAKEQLAEANQTQRNFISLVGHEFRTTLTSIQGFSELLRDEEFNVKEVKEYADDIYQDAMRLSRMLNDLLDLERMQSGKVTMRTEPTDLNAIIQDVAERSRSISPKHTINIQLDKRISPFEGDRDKLIQVTMNLLSNAIKYSPDGGAITIQSQLEDSLIHISIQDEGIGIPPDAIEKLFTPFNRIHTDKTQHIQGTGLGLSIVRQIIEMHHGKVWVESVLGKGSTFHFTLPSPNLSHSRR